MMKVADRNLRHTLFILLGTLLLMYILSIPAYAESTTAVRCIDADGKDMGTQDCLPVAQTMTEGWYVSSDATFNDRIEVSGNVNLILSNDTLLKANAGIEVPSGSELTIWAQTTDSYRMGRLEAVRADGFTTVNQSGGIGSDSRGNAGNITINGGDIWANGNSRNQEVSATGGPGISGAEVTINGGNITAIGKGHHTDTNGVAGAGINGKNIIINGGTVTATGGYQGGSGIGGNFKNGNTQITINGGNVTATGGQNGGAGIGGGEKASFTGDITITGGTVTATGKSTGAGIGSSNGSLEGTITISGGDVTANGSATTSFSGPGIGGSGFTGTIKISDGTVKATGGDRSAGIGAEFARNAKDGHIIIEGGIVIAKGGEGAAGIGGGKENDFGTGGEGCDDVQISGGTVFAQSGTGSCSAIGHGDDDGHMGKITFANGMCVKADTRTDGDMNGAYERNGKPFLWQGKDSVDGRMSACQYRHTALITECEHAATPGENDGIIHVDSTTHLRSVCAYCKRPSVGEPHTYDDSGKCTVCGYKQTICTVTFDANGGSGTMGVMRAAPGGTITLPECGFAAPENKAFAGWDVNDETVDENKPVKISKDTIVKAVWAEAYPLWIGGARVTAVNKMDIFGNGTAKYEGNSSEGTLTLDGAKISASQVYDREKELSAGIIGKLPDRLRIVVNSNSVINVDADQGIYSVGPLAISGNGRLSVHGKSGIECESHITISDGSVVADSDAFGNGIIAKGKFNINNSRVKATGMDFGIKAPEININGEDSAVTARADGINGSAIEASNNISINDGLTIVSPTGGKVGRNGAAATILDGNGKAANKAVISKPVSYNIWVGNTLVTSANYTDVLADDEVNKGRVSFTPAAEGKPAVLRLNGASITTGYSYNNYTYGIRYAGSDPLDIVLSPDSNNTIRKAEGDYSVGIFSREGTGNVTVSGTGTLTVSGSSGGIVSYGDLSIEGGTVTASGSGKDSNGIRSAKNITISGGTVTASASGDEAAGIYAKKDILFSGGEVNASGAGKESAGIRVDENITISGGQVNASSSGSKSYGVYGTGITITGGEVVASGDRGDGFGIYARTVTIQDGKVTSTGGDTAIGNYSSHFVVTSNLNGRGWKDTEGSGAGDYIKANGSALDLFYYRKLVFPTAHEHDFEYTASGATITASCTSEDCPDKQGDVPYTESMTLNAPKHTEYGDGKSAKATVTGHITGIETPAVVYRKGDAVLDEAPTDAGTYTASITVKSVTASTEYVIAPAELTTVTITPFVLIYNGSEQHVAVSKVLAGKLTVPADAYTESGTSATQAGKYTVTVTAKEGSNFTGSASADYHIVQTGDKAFVSEIDVPASGFTYNGEDIKPEVSVKDMETGAQLSTEYYSVSYSDNKNAGYGKVIITGLGEYSNKSGPQIHVFRINKADPAVTAKPTANTLTYTGDPQELVKPGSTPDGILKYAVTKEEATAPDDDAYSTEVPSGVDAGTYYVWYKVVGDENHNDSEPEYVSATISQKSSGGGSSTGDDAVQRVIDKINALPAAEKVTTADKASIEDARKAYDALTEDQKAKISSDTLRKLKDAETALEEAQKKTVKTVTVNTKTINAKSVEAAVTKAGGSSKYVTTIVLGKKVRKISKGAFKNYKNAKTLVVKTKKLKKAKVKKSLKGSKITKVKVKVSSKKRINKKYVKKYKKIFTKKIAGRKVKVSL